MILPLFDGIISYEERLGIKQLRYDNVTQGPYTHL
jgi:hypothetical protein